MNCTIRVAKTKVLISFAVTEKLICAFVFVYADCWFSHEAAELYMLIRKVLVCSNCREIIMIWPHDYETFHAQFS